MHSARAKANSYPRTDRDQHTNSHTNSHTNGDAYAYPDADHASGNVDS